MLLAHETNSQHLPVDQFPDFAVDGSKFSKYGDTKKYCYFYKILISKN